MTLPSVVLPQPDSPTRPSVSPRRTLEGDAVHGPDGADLADAQQAAADLEVLDEVLDAQEHPVGGRCSLLGVLDSDGGAGRAARWSRRPTRSAAHADTVSAAAASSATSPVASGPTAGGSPAGVSQQRES